MLRALDRISLPALVLYLVWGLVSEWVRVGTLGDPVWDDYSILTGFAQQTLAQGSYAWQFEGEGPFIVYAYLPAAALLHAGLARLGEIGGLLWMLAMAISAALGVRAALRLLGWQGRTGRYLATALAVAACSVFIRFDLHFLNGNVIFVGLALIGLERAGRAPIVAALCLTLSLLLKPYGVLLLPYLLLIGRRDVVVMTCAWLVVLGGVVPALALGAAETGALYVDWWETLTRASAYAFIGQISAYNISPAAAVHMLAARSALADDRFVQQGLVTLLRVGWIGTIGWALWPRLVSAWRARTTTRASGLSESTLFGEAAILLVAPLALSNLFQPHQGVAVFPLMLWIVTRAFSPAAPIVQRVGTTLIGLALFGCGAYLPNDGRQGLALLACLSGCVVVAGRLLRLDADAEPERVTARP